MNEDDLNLPVPADAIIPHPDTALEPRERDVNAQVRSWLARKAPATRQAYAKDLSDFAKHLGLRLPETAIARLVQGDDVAAGQMADAYAAAMRDRGVSTSVHFTALHLHAYYAGRFGYRRGMFPVAESISDRTLSAPKVTTGFQKGSGCR